MLLWASAACTAYDPELILPQMMSPSTEQPRAGRGADADIDGGLESDAAPPVEGEPGDVTACGDGRVTGAERCDIAIEPGAPGACPAECPPLNPCAPRALNNAGGCQAECVLLELVCGARDSCCPGKCNTENDPDCSSSCGDGIVQTGSGETCEMDSATPCKTSDADCSDDDACTVDKLMGSQANCNAACSNAPISEPTAGDGCCPSGANANIDSDCPAICGNGAREPGEDCDGGMGCDAACKLTPQPIQELCVLNFGNDPCTVCSCNNCTDTYLSCRGGEDATANQQCSDVLSCSATNQCFGDACYCGSSPLCAIPNGACRSQIEIAAGSSEPLTIDARGDDPAYPVGRAQAASECRRQQCSDVCR